MEFEPAAKTNLAKRIEKLLETYTFAAVYESLTYLDEKDFKFMYAMLSKGEKQELERVLKINLYKNVE